MKRLFCTTLALLLVITLLSGCQSGKKNSSVSNNKGHMEITVSQWDNGNWEKTPEDSWLKKLGERFNVSFKLVTITWEDWNEKNQLWAASGELPDLFVHDENYAEWVEQGLLKPIAIDNYPNIKKTIMPDVLNALTIDGKIYSIPKSHFASADDAAALDAIYVRKDYLEKAGLSEAPDTLEGWFNFLKQAVDEDFSGTGKTIGLKDVKLLTSLPFMKSSDAWVQEDGQWIPSAFSKNHMDEIEFARKLFKEGIMSEDFSIMKIQDERTLFQQGRMAIMQANGDPGMLHMQITPDMGQVTVDDFITLALPPKADDGKRYFNNTLNYWSYAGISAAVSDEKRDRIMDIMEYLASEEGQIFSVYGEEGIDFESIDGTDITSPTQNENIRSLLPINEETGQQNAIWDKYPSAWFGNCFPSWNTWANFINPIYSKEERDKANEYFDSIHAETTIIAPNLEIAFMSSPEKNRLPNLNSMYNELYVQLVMSDDNIKEAFGKWVAEQKSKYQVAIDEVNGNLSK